jgi:hypothetical protein
MFVCSDLWVNESISDLIANRKNASLKVAAELTLFDPLWSLMFGVSCEHCVVAGQKKIVVGLNFDQSCILCWGISILRRHTINSRQN